MKSFTLPEASADFIFVAWLLFVVFLAFLLPKLGNRKVNNSGKKRTRRVYRTVSEPVTYAPTTATHSSSVAEDFRLSNTLKKIIKAKAGKFKRSDYTDSKGKPFTDAQYKMYKNLSPKEARIKLDEYRKKDAETHRRIADAKLKDKSKKKK